MITTRPVFRLAVSLLILSGCNLPLPGTVQEPTSVNLRVQLSVPTDYRTGPGDVYDLIGVLMPGQEFEVVGRSTEGGYLLIRDPAHPEVLGWLKSEGAAVSGVLLGLPIPTPPPTPTPVDGLPPDGGCPTPIGGGPTPVSCNGPSLSSGCPTPIGGGPTPVSCDGLPAGGCPTPIGGGPTPVSCDGLPSNGGCPTPIGGGPTPVSCDGLP
ncbi:MAG: hypothetical protein MUO35_07225, partial [Anaerolineales bacterium]|nr:hypothetical protein [Anaerolineales bacterium]